MKSILPAVDVLVSAGVNVPVGALLRQDSCMEYRRLWAMIRARPEMFQVSQQRKGKAGRLLNEFQ